MTTYKTDVSELDIESDDLDLEETPIEAEIEQHEHEDEVGHFGEGDVTEERWSDDSQDTSIVEDADD